GEAADATATVSVATETLATETVAGTETESTPAYPAPETPTALAAEPAYPAPESASGATATLPATQTPTAAGTAYPAPSEAIAITQWQTNGGNLSISGTSTLPEGTCILTALTINGQADEWWPVDECAYVRQGEWMLTFARSALSPQAPPGASYVLTARAPDYPEAGEAQFSLQAYIPYHSGGN
ncbi:MAG: hypothetical protein ABFD20_04215, partial [Anaerolineales bacterium]